MHGAVASPKRASVIGRRCGAHRYIANAGQPTISATAPAYASAVPTAPVRPQAPLWSPTPCVSAQLLLVVHTLSATCPSCPGTSGAAVRVLDRVATMAGRPAVVTQLADVLFCTHAVACMPWVRGPWEVVIVCCT